MYINIYLFAHSLAVIYEIKPVPVFYRRTNYRYMFGCVWINARV